ncbi:MAG TPA: DUF805 domain-containing protein [Leucothrix mucor]|nr:DUF805 domain-containing protein [Leucothrix mucor]
MKQANPYATPNAKVGYIQQEEDFGNIKVMTSKGRMGRLRFFFYNMLVGLIGMLLIGVGSLGFAVSPVLGGIIVAVIYIAIIFISILLTIQRCHDLNKSGWWALLLLVPFAVFYFYFFPGTKGSNQFGLMPPPNSKGVIAGAILLPFAMFVLMGILSAIALPALQDFEKKVQQAQMEQGQ